MAASEIREKLQILLHSLEKSLMKNLFFLHGVGCH